MSRRCSCLFWLVLTSFLFILFELCLAQSSTPAPVKPTEEEDPIKKVDDTVIYIIVAICLVFVVTVAIVIMVSSWQTRRGPPDRPSSVVRRPSFTRPPVRPSNNKGFSEIREPNDPNGPYELSAIANVYDQQSSESTTWWNIEQDKLIIHPTKVLGSGQFGVILLGDVIKNGQRMTCAVKTLKPDASDTERKSLKIELQNMSTMDPHPNIVNLIGAQQRNGEFFVVVEYCVNGDLYNYVKKNRIDLSARFGRKESGTSIQYFTRLRIAFDIANGMNYLSTKGFIHRDLAARNVLLDDELRAKVSDFGRTRDVGDTYKIFQSFRKNEPIPTRWMPVETLRHQIFTSQSDVWSFGVLLWEIESGATRPYNDLSTYRQVVHKVATEGYRLPQPHNCPDVIYQVMTDCWKIEADERPTFSQIAENFSNLLRAHMPAAEPQYTTLPLVK